MKTSSKTFRGYIKNSLSEKEMDEASKDFFEHKGLFLSLLEVLKVEKLKTTSIRTQRLGNVNERPAAL